VVLKNFDLGAQFFKFHNLRFMPTSTPEEVVGEALVTYEKGFGLTAACEFYVNWPKPMTAVIPLEVTVSIEKCIGTVSVTRVISTCGSLIRQFSGTSDSRQR
jgi:hypothetical protein